MNGHFATRGGVYAVRQIARAFTPARFLPRPFKTGTIASRPAIYRPGSATSSSASSASGSGAARRWSASRAISPLGSWRDDMPSHT